MTAWWVTFTDGSHACCEGQGEYDAKRIAEHFTGKKVAGGEYRNFEVKRLPYPSRDPVWQFEHPLHGKTPPFCMTPEQCAGKTSCPRSRACDD